MNPYRDSSRENEQEQNPISIKIPGTARTEHIKKQEKRKQDNRRSKNISNISNSKDQKLKKMRN